MRTPKIKVKNRNAFKYKKNEVMINHFNDFTEDKIDIAIVLEQGNDIVETKEQTEELEYAIIKVYFKKEFKW